MITGKYIRLSRIFNNGRTVIVPIDDSLISGPENGLFRIEETIQHIINGKPNGLICFKGLLKNNFKLLEGIPIILNITASTTHSYHTRKVLISNVEESLALGADAVAVHINISSRYEFEMLRILGDVSRECEILGMPLMAIIYPRTEINNEDENYYKLKKESIQEYTSLIKHSVRIACDLGADIVKTQFTGTVESFKEVVESSMGKPVIIAGGPKLSKIEALENASMAIKAGASGVCFGRNSYNRSFVTEFIVELKEIVFNNSK
jgi:DhnA family fructose-bisphosphate aldolase class Ia